MSESWVNGALTVERTTHAQTALRWAGGSTGRLTLNRTTVWADGRSETVAVAGAVDVPGVAADMWVDGEAPFGDGIRSITYAMGATAVTIQPAALGHEVISDPVSGVSVPVIGAQAEGHAWESATEVSWLHVQAGGYPLVHARPEQAPTEQIAVYTTSREDRELLAGLFALRRPLLLRSPRPGVPDRWFAVVGARQEQRLHQKRVDDEWRLHEWQAHTLPRPDPATSPRHAVNNLGHLHAYMHGDTTRISWEPVEAPTTRVSSGRYDAFPRVAKLSDGTILACWSSQTDHYQKGGPSYGLMMHSLDGGASWSKPRRYASTAQTPTAIAVFGGRAAMLLRGSGKAWISVSDTPKAGWPAPREITKAQWGTTSWVFASDLIWVDDGSKDGLLLATCYSGDGLHVTASADGGVTWKARPQPFPARFASNVGPAEPCLSLTADGRLLMLIRWDRRFIGATVADGDIWACWSSDMGKSWTAPVMVIPHMTGQPAVTLMPDGSLLATLRDAALDGSVDSWVLGESRDHGLSWTTSDISHGRMMYGSVVPLSGDAGLLVSSDETALTTAIIWTMPLRHSSAASSDLGGIAARWPGTLADIAAADLSLGGAR